MDTVDSNVDVPLFLASPWVFCNRQGDRVKDVKRGFASACEQVGIVDFRIHDLRHTAAAWMLNAGAALMEVKEVLGHSSITMTERYAHLAPDNARSAVERLNGCQLRFGHGEFSDQVSGSDDAG